jgi:hypothetical protein
MSRSRKLLITSGIVLLICGMCDGLFYALFREHQRLEQMGVRLANGFARAAQGDVSAAHDSIRGYGETKFRYVREVDVHSHWSGLAVLLILLGVAFPRLAFPESQRFWLALALVVGSVGFPLSVLAQNWDHGLWPRVIAVISSGLIITAMAVVAMGFVRDIGHSEADPH